MGLRSIATLVPALSTNATEFFPETKAFLPVPQSWIGLDGLCWCPHHSRMVRRIAIRELTTHAGHVNPCFASNWSAVGSITITCNRFVGFPSTWLFLIIWSKSVFGLGVFAFLCGNNQNKCCSRRRQKRAPGRLKVGHYGDYYHHYHHHRHQVGHYRHQEGTR